MPQDSIHSEAAPGRGPVAFVRRYSGVTALVASMVVWGSLPLYWKLLDDVPPVLILCHRMFWSFVLVVPLTFLLGQGKTAMEALRTWRTVRILLLSSMVLACNWLLYIWAVVNGQVLATSLGYYIMPLLNVCAGIFIFGDRPRRAQYIAILLAFIGVAAQVVLAGAVPWVALGLAFSFGAYGLLRKIVPVESLAGLAVETSLLMLPALGGVIWGAYTGFSFLDGTHPWRDALLVGAGVMTTLPLLWFAHGVRRIPLITVGIVQYLSPSIAFAIGVFVLDEPFSFADALAFCFIWAALALYSVDGIRAHGPGAGGN